jgi:hypothetical protein
MTKPKRFISILGFASLAVPLLADEPAQPGAKPAAAAQNLVQAAAIATDNLPRFDLDFHGGSPKDLVGAINEALSEKPGLLKADGALAKSTINVIIPDDSQEIRLPAMSLKNISVSDLFRAVTKAGNKTVQYRDGFNNEHMYNAGYSFTTEDHPANPNSVWYFSQQKPASWREDTNVPPKECRFYQLSPYLETYKVEDITTAVETAWKMLGETNLPVVSFHKDTKLLIAVGDERDLRLIDTVLQQLKPPQQGGPVPGVGSPIKPIRP